jgi:hypothetical protein
MFEIKKGPLKIIDPTRWVTVARVHFGVGIGQKVYIVGRDNKEVEKVGPAAALDGVREVDGSDVSIFSVKAENETGEPQLRIPMMTVRWPKCCKGDGMPDAHHEYGM